MIQKISHLVLSFSALIAATAALIWVLQGRDVEAKKPYEVPRQQLRHLQIFSYQDLIGLFDPIKGQIYYYKDNIYVKTARIAEPGANLMILY